MQSAALTPSEKLKRVPLPSYGKSKLCSTPPASQRAHAALERSEELRSTSLSAPDLGLNNGGLRLLRKQECAARCLAGSWLRAAIGTESSLSASTLILINRSTATVPPRSSPEHSQPLPRHRSSVSSAPAAGNKAKSCADLEQLRWLQPSSRHPGRPSCTQPRAQKRGCA